MDASKLNAILDRYQRDPSCLLAILQDIQKEERYVPKEVVKDLAKALDVSVSRIYGLATFFSALSLEPRGKHTCSVCLGTACHVRGAPRLLDHIQRECAVLPGKTTADMELTLETVNCVGACALGPLVIMDGDYHGNMTTTQLDKLLKSIK